MEKKREWTRFGLLGLALAALLLSACGSDGGTPACTGAGCLPACEVNGDCATGTICDPATHTCVARVDGDPETDGETEAVEETRLIRVSPGTTLDYENVEFSQKPEIALVLYNDGNAPLHLADLNWLEPMVGNPWSAPQYYAATIQGGQSYTVKVRMEPTELGELTGKLRINNDSTNVPELDITLHAVVVQDSGLAIIGSDPESVVMDDQPVGKVSGRKHLRIGNAGGGDSRILLTGYSLKSGSGAIFKVLYEAQGETKNSIDSENPIVISAASSQLFTVDFDPVAVGDFTDTVTFVYHTDKDQNPKDFDVAVSGKGIVGAVLAYPSPIDFGDVVVSGNKALPVRLINGLTSGPLTITSIKPGVNAAEWNFFSFTPPLTLPQTLQPGDAFDFTLTYRPQSEAALNTLLMVGTLNNGDTYHFPITATGKAANAKPIARISLTDHGANVSTEVPVAVGDSLQFFGGSSYDPDGDSSKLTYRWSLQKPGASTSTFIPNDTAVNVSALFDVAGSFVVALVVVDEQGAESDPKLVRVSSSAALTSVRIEMVAGDSISGHSDANLSWILPSGRQCDQTTVNANGTCMLPDGEGSVNVSACADANACTTETITHTGAPDGLYQISVRFVESCPETNFNCPLGYGEEELKFDLRIFVNGQPHQALSNLAINSQGGTLTWNLISTNGTWGLPTLVQ